MLVLTDPTAAAKRSGEAFKVTVVAEDGRQTAADYATAASLTFLKEAIGCPLTNASALYARLLGGEPSVEWGGASARFASVARPDKPGELRHGIVVSGPTSDAA